MEPDFRFSIPPYEKGGGLEEKSSYATSAMRQSALQEADGS